MQKLFQSYLRSSPGSFAIYFAIAFVVLATGVSAAIDLAGMSRSQTKMQNFADSMALAGAALDTKDTKKREKVAMAYYNENKSFPRQLKFSAKPEITADNLTYEVDVTLVAKYQPMMMGALGFGTKPIEVHSTSGFGTEAVAPFTIGFVFDVSGSMGWLTSDGDKRIDVLKKATEDLFKVLLEANGNKELTEAALSTGYASYNTSLFESEGIESGYEHVVDAVKDFEASGGTNSSPGMQFIYDQMLANKHSAPDLWTGYVVFMTDGNNNIALSDTETLDICRDFKNERITVYTVAFEAPLSGQSLLRTCAFRNGEYFNATDGRAMRKAFVDIAEAVSETVVRIKH